MKIDIRQMLPSNDMFEVMKENTIDVFKFERWNHGSYVGPLQVGVKIVSDGVCSLMLKPHEETYGFYLIDPNTGCKSRDCIGISESDLATMLDDEIIDYIGPFNDPGLWGNQK